MRVVGILLALMVVVAPLRVARGGACPTCPPPVLEDGEQRPTVKQAIAAARKLLRAIRAKRRDRFGPLMPHPSLVDLAGRGDGDCADYRFFRVEGESGWGQPACVFAALASRAKKLDAALSKGAVYASLEKLEKKRGILRTPSRAYLEPLAKHRLVYVKSGSVRVVIAVMLTNTEEPVAVVDGLFVEPPKDWTPPRPK